MEAIATLFTSVFSLFMLGMFHTENYCRNDIIDIYYPPDQEMVAYDSDCHYTRTVRNCLDCPVLLVRRSRYDEFVASYAKYGLPAPVPRRYDTHTVFEPRPYYQNTNTHQLAKR